MLVSPTDLNITKLKTNTEKRFFFTKAHFVKRIMQHIMFIWSNSSYTSGLKDLIF